MPENTVDDRPDNWWWLVIKTPTRDTHLFELGYENEPLADGSSEPLSHGDLAGYLAAVGGPAPEALSPESGWEVQMAPGRPNHLLEPKAYSHEGALLPIRAKAGVTLHLLPADKPQE